MSTLKLTTISLLFCVVMYLFVSFVKWQTNPAQWDWSDRAISVLATTILIVILIDIKLKIEKSQGGEQ